MLRFSRPTTLASLVLLVVAAWVFWLRWPTFGHTFWNLDEGIYATVGRTVLEGGVMYRDAIDHRSPFCHYLTAGIFAVAGINNAWAMHAALAGLISLLAFGLFLLGRLWRDPATGLWAAAVGAALSTDLFYVGDAYSLGTEWVLAFFSTWAAWFFWISWPRGGFRGPFVAGAGYAAAFMSKQPGLLEVGAPLALLAYVAATGRLTRPAAARVLVGLAAGFSALLSLVFAYFWWHDTLQEFYFYGWAYNLVYYGADTSLAERLAALWALPRFLWTEYPLLLIPTGLAVLRGLYLVSRDRPSADAHAAQPGAVFLLSWLALSAAGAAAAGRVHPHYYIQALPALALAAAWVLGPVTGCLLQPGRWWLRAGAAGLALATAWTVVSHPGRTRAALPLGRDSGWIPADYIRARTRPSDRIFVWGLYPDFYVFADRAPASRYIYTSFQTGVQPGRNTAPGLNTDDVAVAGSLTALCRELEANRPLYFVDTSLGAQRLYDKYPLHRYPLLEKFVSDHYTEVDPMQFRVHGFRVLLLKDAARGGAPPAVERTGAGQPDEPVVLSPPYVDGQPTEIDVHAGDPTGGLQRLELLIDGAVADGITFAPSRSLHARFKLTLGQFGPGRHRVAARATSRGGVTRTSAEALVDYAPDLVPAARLGEFPLSVVSTGIPPGRVIAPFGVVGAWENGALVISANAPSLLSYTLTPRGARLTGRFGIRPGAYAASNPGPTDGAEFIITWTGHGQPPVELVRRLLRPAESVADRSEQVFDCPLPLDKTEGRLEFAIRAGPNGNAASDWTYWSDLTLRPRP